MKSFEIPFVKERPLHYRLFEMFPGLLSWFTLILPFILAFINPRAAAFFIIAYLLIWFAKAVGMNIRVLQGWKTMQKHMKYNWTAMLTDLETGEITVQDPSWHAGLVRDKSAILAHKPSEIFHLVIIPTYNEAREVLEPTIQTVLKSNYPMDRVIFVLAYEERGGQHVEDQARGLIADYGHLFYHAMTVKHTVLPGEVKGKGGNATWAARVATKYCDDQGLDPAKVLVTTLDSDNRPHEQYLAGVTYTYCASPDPLTTSYQPIPMFTNNIWDAPAPMRVIATGNSFWMVVSAMRPHMLRNFSAHTQALATLIATDYWSVRTVVEDGHQYWRTYFRFDGRHEVYPIMLPIYQDAVLTANYRSTLKAQFFQMARWAWGASDIAYVVHTGFFKKNKVPKLDLFLKLLRLIEGHWSWATAPLVLLFAAFIPLLFYPQDYAANELPQIASRVQQVAMLGIAVTLFLSFKALPPKPERYKRHRTILMLLQWILLPVTTICYSAGSGLYSQTRLLLGKYFDVFNVTTKAVVKEDKSRIV